MIVHQRQISRVFSATHKSLYQTLLVSGCSYTYNNSNEHICAWPYYLRDLAEFQNVLDASQSGSGITHALMSSINEVVENDLNQNVLTVVMLSGLNRVDVIIDKNLRDTSLDFSTGSPYHFDADLVSDSIKHYKLPDKNIWNNLYEWYHKLIPNAAIVLQNSFNILALHSFFKSRQMPLVLVNFEDQSEVFNQLPNYVRQQLTSIMAPIISLGEFANQFENGKLKDGHPTVDSSLAWTRQILLPYLKQQGYIVANDITHS